MSEGGYTHETVETSAPQSEDTSKLVPVANTISFHEAAEYNREAHGHVVHLKGFGQRIPYDDPKVAQLADIAVDKFVDLKPDTLVWDGDSFHHDSFTALIPRIYSHRRCEPKPKLVMFLKKEDQERVNDSWLNVDFLNGSVTIECYLFASGISFRQLGILAIRKTQSKAVVSVGGGQVVSDEFDRTSAGVIYYYIPVQRRMSIGTDWESSALEEKFAEKPPKNLVMLNAEQLNAEQ